MLGNPPEERQPGIGPFDNRGSGFSPCIPDHELVRCIGSGSYGEVWLARNVMGTYRAVKVVYRQTFSDERPYEREFHGMQKFEPVSRSHDGLVDILQVGRNDPAGYYYYVMELGDDLESGQAIDPDTYEPKTLGKEAAKRGRLSFDECLQVGLSLSAALNHLHEQGLIHRDIKPSNIIFVNGIPKVADIGLVAAVGTSKSLVGTEGFMPPEGPGSIQGDLYSLGKVLYEISTGHDRRDFPELPTQLAEFSEPEDFLELNEVILRACESDVRKRYRTGEEMRADLVLLQAGKSVRRLRLLEKRVAFLTRVGAVTAVALLVAAGILYQVSRELKIAAERKHQQVSLIVGQGTRFVDGGDFFGSLLPFVQALGLDRDDARREHSHRVRIAAVLRQCPRIIQMWFLDGQINSADFSRDGRYVIAAGADGIATLCDTTGNATASPWIHHTNELEAVSFSRDGRFVLVAGANSAQVWELGAKQPVRSVAPPAMVYSARFSPDGSQFVTASGADNEGYVWLFDTVSEGPGREFLRSKAAYRCAAFSPDGRRLVTAGEDNRAQVWDITTKRPIGRPIQHSAWVYYAGFSPDGQQVATASFDGTAQVCAAETGLPILPPLKHTAAVKSAEFSPDGRYLVTACWDYTARIWSVGYGEEIQPVLKQSGKFLQYASFSPDGRRVLAVNANGVICLWDLSPIGWLPAFSRSFPSVDGGRLVTIQSNSLALREAASNSVPATIELSIPVKDVKFNRAGSRVATLSEERLPSGVTNTVAQLWDALTGHALSGPFAVGPRCVDAALIADGRDLVVLSGTNVQIWNSTEGKLLFSFGHRDNVTKVALSPDGHWLATSSETNAYLWDLVQGKKAYQLPHPDTLGHLEFSRDGRRLVTCCRSDGFPIEREAQVWDVLTGVAVGAALQHSDGVLHASFSPDGKRVVTASEDATARVWDAATGRPLLSLQHGNQVYEASFSEDGHWIVTACRDKTARVWDAETGDPLTPPLKHPWEFAHAQFLAHDRGIITRRSTGDSAFWELPRDEHPIEELEGLAQLLSGRQLGYTGGVLPQTKKALRDAWQKLRARRPADFAVSQDEIVAWHRREAEGSEKAGLWSAAVFQWEQLIQVRPEEQGFRERRAHAKERLDAVSFSSVAPEAESR